ncbi:MAG: PAS domain S-box protein, partial [Bacteroidetes bacterium]|nr:PAS domain S-box protein [Bacteroidota bacterium]
RDEEGMADAFNNLGESFFNQGEFDKAFEYLNRSLELEKKLGNKYGMAESYHTLGLSYFELSELNKAIEYNLKSFAIADSLSLSVLLVEIYNLFYKIYEKKKNYALALENYRNYALQKDSIYNPQFHSNLAEIQAKYEIDRYDRERVLMTQEAYVKGKEIRTQRVYLIIIFFLMIVFGILVYYDIKSKLKANARLREINKDLTIQKEKLMHTLDALSKSESKYKNLVENSPTGILYIDHEGNILEVNRKILEILGSPGEAATKQINCLTFPLLQKVGLSDAILKSIATREVIYNESPYTSKWGKEVYLRYYITPIADSEDKISNLIINIEDFTQKQEAEQLKIKSESQYKILVENSLQAMLIIQDGKLIFANSRMEYLTQYKFSELAEKQGHWLKSLIHPEDFGKVITNIELALKKKKIPTRNEYKYIRKDGAVRWIETLGSVVDYNNKPAILVVAIDITERKENESILIESEKQLRKANVMKDKFFSIIAHDLKNPFGSIMGFSSLLYEAYDNFDDKQRKTFIKNICETSENTFKLLQNLLEWSKTQTGKFEFIPVNINIYEIAEENLSVLKSSAGNKKIKLINKIKENTFVWADENMVKAVIRNLLTNAIKFTYNGGRVEVSTKNTGKFIEVCFADTGKGSEPENLERLFRIDDQYKTPGTVNEEGSGLGLILCKEFIEKNGGKIWVESEPGTGSRFKFTLQAENPAEPG